MQRGRVVVAGATRKNARRAKEQVMDSEQTYCMERELNVLNTTGVDV